MLVAFRILIARSVSVLLAHQPSACRKPAQAFHVTHFVRSTLRVLPAPNPGYDMLPAAPKLPVLPEPPAADDLLLPPYGS